MKSVLADGLAAALTHPVGAIRDTSQRVIDLLEHVTRVIGERHLVLPLEGLAPCIGLIVTRSVSGIADQVGETLFGGSDLLQESLAFAVQFGTHLGELRVRPR